MRARRRLFCIITTLLAVILDVSVLPFTGLNMSYVPRLCLVNAALIGTVLGATQGIIYGAFAGALLDITVYQPAGVTALMYTLCGLVSGFLTHRVRPWLVTLVPSLSAFLLYEAGMAVYTYFITGYFPGGKIGFALIRAVISLALTQILYLPYLRALKPSKIGKGRHR